MINIELRIKKILIEKGITMRKLVGLIDMTENGFAYSIKNKTIKLQTIEKIATNLEVPVSYFFDENTDYKKNFHVDKVEHNGNGHIINAKNINNGSTNKDELFLLHENELLKERIRGLEKEIEGKNKIIELYQKFTDEYEDELNSK